MRAKPERETPAGAGRWYAAHTQPHREFAAALQLQFQGFGVFLPAHIKTVRHARQFRTVKAAFFPRYLFVRLDLERDRWRSVNGTSGISQMIMEGERPKPVPPGVVEDLIAMAGSDGLLDFEPKLQPGDSVQILSGAFTGMIGELVKLDPDGRVEVLLGIMGGRIRIHTRSEQLAPIS